MRPPGEPGAGQCILTTTLCIVLFTVLSMGGSIYTVLTPHGLSSKKMALITSDYGIMRSLSIKWP